MKTKILVLSGIFGGLAFLLTFLEFPIFPVLPFLKFDASDSLVIYIAMFFGYIPSFLTLTVKSILFLFKSGDGGIIGIFMNFIAGIVFISILYKLKSKLNLWIVFSIASTAVGITMCFVNNYISIPVYTNMKTATFVEMLGLTSVQFFSLVIAFNVIKFMADSIIAYLLYKKTKSLIKE